jgi:hypothetical protein
MGGCFVVALPALHHACDEDLEVDWYLPGVQKQSKAECIVLLAHIRAQTDFPSGFTQSEHKKEVER